MPHNKLIFFDDLDVFINKQIGKELDIESSEMLVETKQIISVYLLVLDIPLLYERHASGFDEERHESLISGIRNKDIKQEIIAKFQDFDSHYSDVSIYADANAIAKVIGAEQSRVGYWIREGFIEDKCIKQYTDFEPLNFVIKNTHPETFVNCKLERFLANRIPRRDFYLSADESGNLLYNSTKRLISEPIDYLFEIDSIPDLISNISMHDNVYLLEHGCSLAEIERFCERLRTAAKIRRIIMNSRYAYVAAGLGHIIQELSSPISP